MVSGSGNGDFGGSKAGPGFLAAALHPEEAQQPSTGAARGSTKAVQRLTVLADSARRTRLHTAP